LVPATLALVLLAVLAGPRAGPAGAMVALPLAALAFPAARARLAESAAARLAWLLPGVFLLPDLLFGAPAPARLALAGAGGLLVGIALLDRGLGARVVAGLGRRPTAALLTAGVALWCGLATLPIHNGADVRLGQDTAYFTQVVHRAAHGEAPRGDVVTALLYDPPLQSHFGAHVSPVVSALAPFQRLVPDWRTLAWLRGFGLLVGALLLWRARSLPASVRGLALLVWWAHPSLWMQPMHTVYLLPLAVPGAGRDWIGAWERRWGPWALGLLWVFLVREDAALFVGAGSWFLTLGRRGPSRFGWVAATLGLLWYGACTALVMPRFGSASGQAVAGLFDEVGGPLGLITHPDETLRRLAAPEAWRSLWHHLRSTGGLSRLHPVGLAAIPAQAVNALANVGGFGTLHPGYHYAVLPAAAVATGAALGLGRRGDATGLSLPRLGRLPWAAVLAVVLSGAGLGALDTLDREKVAHFRAPAPLPEVRGWMRDLPAEWSIAAPRAQLPWLAHHRELYLANRLPDYPAATPDAWLVTDDVASLQLRDGTEPAYRALLASLPDRAEPIRTVGSWTLYLRPGLELPTP